MKFLLLARLGSARLGSARLGSARLGSARLGSTRLVALFVAAFGVAQASPDAWTYHPPRAGKALLSGGWAVEYPLGRVNASREFDFPLQLIYQTTRTQEGLFGSAWSCPQLESTVLPLAKGYLMWTMPSGQQVLLEQNPDQNSEYLGKSGSWTAKVTPSRQEITAGDGWTYFYSKGKLESVVSPTRRSLDFEWKNGRLIGLQLRDLATNRKTLLLTALYGENKRIKNLKLLGQLHRFAYTEDGTKDRLTAWDPPVGETAKFLYHPESGVLRLAGIGDTTDPSRIEEFKTRFVDPSDSTAPSPEEVSFAKKNPANYWLVSDRHSTYSYGTQKAGKSKRLMENPGAVTLRSRDGLEWKTDYAENRGIVTTRQGSSERKDYYFRAPGQRYDGKLRRTEENGKLALEYRYDRKSGLLTETIDARGISTFFEYDPSYKPGSRNTPEPKPIRVRRGTRRSSELVAEYAYDSKGNLTAAKDGEGNLTRYSYTPRGEIASVTNPAGDKAEYSYDAFGRLTKVSSAGRSETVEYDELGRPTAQVSADGTKSEMIYDEHGHLSQIKRNGKVTKELVRDEFHRVVGEKDPLNRLSRVERDVRGNLTAEIAPNGSVTRFEYDESDRRIAQIDGNGNKITFAYDAAGRMIRQTNALGNSQSWRYDEKIGKLIERYNGVQTIRHQYNADGTMESIDYGSGQLLSYTYDKEGRPLSVTGPDSTFETSYDKQGRPLALRAVASDQDYLLSYRYNLRGQRTGLLISANTAKPDAAASYQPIQQTEQQYDAAGRLCAILTNGIPAISYAYDLTGRPVRKIYGIPQQGKPALTVDIAYDEAGHLARMSFYGGRLTSPLDLRYEWDEADQLSRRSWNGLTLRYAYDPSGQLLKVIDDSDQSTLEAYTYDAAGNMLSKFAEGRLTAMTYNAGNQLVTTHDLGPATAERTSTLPTGAAELAKLAQATFACHYDRAGRLLGTGEKPTKSYGWLDKLIDSSLPDGTTLTHHYWPDGQLASIFPSSNQHSKINNPQSSISPSSNQHSKINNPQSSISPSSDTFLWDGLALIKRNDTIYLIEPHPSGGIPIASHPVGKPGEITHHLNDMLGTTLATVGPSGLKFTQLSSFGQPLKSTSTNTNSPASPSTPANPLPSTNQLPPSAP